MSERNLLLGNGERLTTRSEIKTSSGPKKYPYSLEEIRSNLRDPIKNLHAHIENLEVAAKPRGEGVFKITLHPAFLGRSYFPSDLLRTSGLRDIGSKQVNIIPRKAISEKNQGKSVATATLFVAGSAGDVTHFEQMLYGHKLSQAMQKQFLQIESLEWLGATEKIKSPLDTENGVLLKFEAVLHAGHQEDDIVHAFIEYAKKLNIEVLLRKKIVVGSLTFIPLIANKKSIPQLALFSFLRVIREMPELRIALPNLVRQNTGISAPPLPAITPIDRERRIAVFDGGIGADDLAPWVTEYTYPDTNSTNVSYLHHGTEVTSTILFGRLDEKNPAFGQPYMHIDHYRVISPNIAPDVDLFDVLTRIRDVLDTGKYPFANLSLGPRLPIQDDEVHAWTATLDQVCAKHGILATVAVGNDGDTEDKELARIQPPSDMVNALAVGAADHYGKKWGRAPYSCTGPGRSPGVVKPDGVAFGGTSNDPFFAYNPWVGGIAAVAGTSYAAPLTMRTAVGAAALTSHPLDAIAIKALLIHHAEKTKLARQEVGWGRFLENPNALIECGPDTATVIYQGVLAKGEYLRAPVPFPGTLLPGAVTIKATLCIQAPTDPEHVINYTRAGMQVVFRPRFGLGEEDSNEFFGRSSQYRSEQEFRDDGHKWETTLHREKKFNADTELSDPVFDIRYHARAISRSVTPKSAPDMRYAMVISIKVEGASDLYNLIRQRYQVLQPVQLRAEIDVLSS